MFFVNSDPLIFFFRGDSRAVLSGCECRVGHVRGVHTAGGRLFVVFAVSLASVGRSFLLRTCARVIRWLVESENVARGEKPAFFVCSFVFVCRPAFVFLSVRSRKSLPGRLFSAGRIYEKKENGYFLLARMGNLPV